MLLQGHLQAFFGLSIIQVCSAGGWQKGHHVINTYHPCATNCTSYVCESARRRRNADQMRLSLRSHASFHTQKKTPHTTNDRHNCLDVILGTPREPSAVFFPPAKLNLKSGRPAPPPASNAISTAVKRLLERALISKYHHLALRGRGSGGRGGWREKKCNKVVFLNVIQRDGDAAQMWSADWILPPVEKFQPFLRETGGKGSYFILFLFLFYFIYLFLTCAHVNRVFVCRGSSGSSAGPRGNLAPSFRPFMPLLLYPVLRRSTETAGCSVLNKPCLSSK